MTPSNQSPMQRNVLLVIQPAYPPRLQGIARFASSHGWHLTIVDRLARFPRGWRGDGALVTLRGNENTNRFVKGLAKSGIPVVDLTFNHPEIKLPRVSGDHVAFGRIARQHFKSLNFRNFAWFSSTWTHVHELRYNGFVGDQSQSIPRWVLSNEVSPDELDNWRLFLRIIGKKLKKVPKPLAILAYDDTDAAKLLSAALEAGVSVPEDVAIMGIGNDTLICENQAVPLSSVDHDLERNGYEGAKLLDKLMTERSHGTFSGGCHTILIPPNGIIVRKSTNTLATDDPLLAAALKEITNRISTSFGVDDIAKALNVSRTKLDLLFAEKFARSIGKEISRQRIELSKRLLTETNKPLKEISSLCGFCNPGYFTNAFRLATGQSPKIWRLESRQ